MPEPLSAARTPGRAALGRRAEALAVRHLASRGMRVLARNWRRPQGEIDLVAQDGGVVVFVEVRSRSGSERGHPLETIDARKRGRIVRAARLYLDEEQPLASAFRFDAMGVVFHDDGRAPECEYVERAFEVDR